MTRAWILAAALAPAVVHAEPTCLPKAAFAKSLDSILPAFDLGLVAGVPTLCALPDDEHAGYLGCWSVDPRSGKLSASTATALPGHARRGKTDAKGCVEGFCPVPKPEADALLLWVTSTDGRHVAILHDAGLQVFDAVSKKATKVIPLMDEKAPGETNVGNAPIDILYVGSSLHVVGSDAGPYMGVWSYKDDGTRIGILTRTAKPDEGSYNVYAGAANVLDDTRVGFADAGLKSMFVITVADGSRTQVRRAVKSAPCKPEDLEYLEEGNGASKACRKTIKANFEPWMDIDPILLPSGDYLAALAGKQRGTIAVLDGKKLTEKKRFKLKRCAK